MSYRKKDRLDRIILEWATRPKDLENPAAFKCFRPWNRWIARYYDIVIVPGDDEPTIYGSDKVKVGSMFLAHFGILGYYLFTNNIQ